MLSQRDEPADTIAALDKMEDNLRHHGLGHDQPATVVDDNHAEAVRALGPAAPPLDGSAAYMATIRSAKEERRRLRVEKEYRQYMSTQQEARSAKALSEAVEERAARAAIVDGAGALLQAETAAAAAAVKAHNAATLVRAARAEQVEQRQQQERQILVNRMAEVTAAACAEEPQTSIVTLTSTSPSSKNTPQPGHQSSVKDICDSIANGLIDLAVRVSDNRFLPSGATDTAGLPVRRTEQDLPVTAWRQWVQECVWDGAMTAATPCDKESITDPKAGQPAHASGTRRSRLSVRSGSTFAATFLASENADQSSHEKDTEDGAVDAEEAWQHVAFAAQQQQAREAALSSEAVAACLELLQGEEDQLRKMAAEDVRRASDAAVEEVYPGWAQRMPPAGCFVFGDDLSGARLLSETVDKAFLAITNGGAAAGAAQSHRRGSLFSDGSSVQTSGPASTAKGTAAAASGDNRRTSTAHPPSSQPSHVIGVTRTEQGIERTYVTPRTLLNQFPATGAAGGLSRGHSGGRARNAATGKGNASVSAAAANSLTTTAGAGLAPSGGATVTGAMGGALSNNTSVNGASANDKTGAARRASTEEEERREQEVLAEALSRELVAVHVHNLHVGTQGRLPESLAAVHASNTAMAAASGTGSTSNDKTPVKRSAAGGGGSSGRSNSTHASASRQGDHNSGRREPSPGRGTIPPADVVVAERDAAAEAGTPPPPAPLVLHTLTLVGFPQSESFYQLLQQRLHTAVDAAEHALVLYQVYHQLADEAAAEQLAGLSGGSGAMNTTPPRAQRSKSNAQPQAAAPAPTGTSIKGGRSNGKPGASEANLHAALAADLALARRAQTAFPPLCMVGCFLEYGVVERRRRLSGAYLRGYAAATTTPTVAGGVTSQPVPLFHDVWCPECLVGTYGGYQGTGGGSVAAAATGSAVGNHSPLTTDTASSPVSAAGLLAAQAFARKAASVRATEHASAAPHVTPGRDGRVSALPVAQVRQLLLSQQHDSAVWPARWPRAFVDAVTLHRLLHPDPNQPTSTASGAGDGAAQANAPPGRSTGAGAHVTSSSSSAATAAVRDGKGKRRRNTNTSSQDAHQGHSSASTPQPDAAAPATPAEDGVAAAVTFPKVLFFTRTCAVPSVSAQNDADGDQSPSIAPSEELPLYAFRSSNPHLDADRRQALRHLCRAMAACTTPSVTPTRQTRVFTAESLAPRQLPAPLRLSDYHRSPQVCALLITTHRAYTDAFSPSQKAPAASSGGAGGDRVPPVLAGMEAFRAFNTYVYELYRVVAHDVFPASLWSPGEGGSANLAHASVRAVQTLELTNTMHFNSIDGSYESAKARVGTYRAAFVSHLRRRCLVWWLHTLEAGLDTTAATLQHLVQEVQAAYRDAGICRTDVRHAFLEQTRRLTECEQERVADLFVPASVADADGNLGEDRHPTCADLMGRLWALHDDFLAEARHAATRVLLSAFHEMFPSSSPTSSPAAVVSLQALEQPSMVDVIAVSASVLSAGTVDTATSALPDPLHPVNMVRPEWAQTVPALVDRIFSRVLAQGNDHTDGAVSPFLAQCATVVNGLTDAFAEAGHCAERWLRAMYHVALQVAPNGGGSFPAHGARPTSVSEFFDPLPAALSAALAQTGPATAAATPSAPVSRYASPTPDPLPASMNLSPMSAAAAAAGVSAWQRVNFTTYVCNLSLHNSPSLDEDAFVHSHVLTQLQSLWEHLTDTSADLAAAVGVAVDAAHAVIARPSSAAAQQQDGGECSPGALWMHSFLTLCDCRPSRHTDDGPGPFLSLDEIRTLFRHHADHTSGRLELRRYLLSVVLRRVCFCGPTAATTCPWHARWAVPSPTAREIRAVVATLPACVRDQLQAGPVTASPNAVNGVSDEAAQAWASVRWWPVDTSAVMAQNPMWACAGSVPWVLLLALTTRFAFAKSGCLQFAYPALPEVLRMLTECGTVPEVNLERLFHAVAVLPRAQRQASGISRDAVFKPADVDAIELTVDEFAFYGGALERTTTTTAAAATGHQQEISLRDDAELLLLSSEPSPKTGVSGVTLPPLLASHWGRALVQAQFV